MKSLLLLYSRAQRTEVCCVRLVFVVFVLQLLFIGFVAAKRMGEACDEPRIIITTDDVRAFVGHVLGSCVRAARASAGI